MQHGVTARRPTVLMRILCAEWCTWSNTESQRAGPQCLLRILCAEWCTWSNIKSQHAGPQCLCASCVQNDALEATLSHSTQAHSAYAHPVCRMMHLKQHRVTVRRPTVLMRIMCAEWCTWSNTESQRAGPQCLCASCAQNDALEATLSHITQAQRSGVRIEKFKAQRKEILMRSVLNLCHSLLRLFF